MLTPGSHAASGTSSSPSARRSARTPAVIAAIAAGIAVLLAVTAIGGSGSEPSAPAEADRATDTTVDPALTRGAEDAPVVMTIYSEFQCPYCGRFARDTKPELIERFVQDGTLRMEWRDLPYLGQESVNAAAAGRAAAAQGRFWEYHDHLFADQGPPNRGVLTGEHLVGIAGDLGLDTERFRQDLTSDATADAIGADIDRAVALGINGTPAFLVNGEMIIGAQPTPVFVEAVERASRADD